MELFLRLFVVEFNIRTSLQKIFLNLFSQRFIAIFIAINHYGNAPSDSAQQVKRLYIDIVIDNSDGLLRHTVNLRIGDIGVQPLSVKNQEMLVGRVGSINYPALKVQGFVCRMRMGRE